MEETGIGVTGWNDSPGLCPGGAEVLPKLAKQPGHGISARDPEKSL